MNKFLPHKYRYTSVEVHIWWLKDIIPLYFFILMLTISTEYLACFHWCLFIACLYWCWKYCQKLIKIHCILYLQMHLEYYKRKKITLKLFLFFNSECVSIFLLVELQWICGYTQVSCTNRGIVLFDTKIYWKSNGWTPYKVKVCIKT